MLILKLLSLLTFAYIHMHPFHPQHPLERDAPLGPPLLPRHPEHLDRRFIKSFPNMSTTAADRDKIYQQLKMLEEQATSKKFVEAPLAYDMDFAPAGAADWLGFLFGLPLL